MSINSAILLGRLGNDPELRYSGKSHVCNFSLATNEKWVNESGKEMNRTTWHQIKVFGKLADLCGEYLKKGSQVFIEGSIQNRSWTNDLGVKKYISEIKAKEIKFLDGAKKKGNDTTVSENESFTTDDIPF